MLSVAELKRFVSAAAKLLLRENDLGQFEIYAASSLNRIARLAYTSDIPCRGVEEIKSLGADGFQIRIAMRRDPHETGTATEAGDFSLEAVQRVLDRARRAAIVDPHFPGFPIDRKKLAARSTKVSDLARASDKALATSAWQVIGGALRAFKDSGKDGSGAGLVIGGDVSLIHDRIALGGSNLPEIRADESAHFMSSVTALIESVDAKGTETAVGGSMAQMRKSTSVLGRDAVARALGLGVGVRPVSGRYRVVLGPQPIAEILNYMVMGSVTTGAFYAASSAYQSRFGQRVMDQRINLTDDPMYRNGPVRRAITCEGLKSAKTTLIKEGKLVGLLSSLYDSHRLETDDARTEKLGSMGTKAKFPPSAGYRLGEGADGASIWNPARPAPM
jgi:predicted Zn-dependent protease